MKNLLAIVGSIFVLASCTFYEPEIAGVDNIKLNNFEGREASFNVTARVKNDNGYAIKIKPSTLDVYVDDEYMGKIHLDKKVKFKKKQVTTIDAPLTATIAEGAVFRAMTLLNKSKVQLRLNGKVKAGVWFVSKKLDVDERKTIDPSLLKNLSQK